MPRKQRRYKTEAQILRAIDDMEIRIHGCFHQMETLEEDIKRIPETVQPTMQLEAINYNRSLIAKLNRSADRMEKKKKVLGDALSRLRTMTLPGMNLEDNSVTL